MSHPDFSGSVWIEPDSVNNSALLFLTLIYAVILYQSSNLISGGSELLLLVPSVASLVGSIVLPILGAVPDGTMTLFSGLGPDAQSEVGIGVGVLAGSTVMLLTFPWFIAVMAGRVPLVKGEAVYKTSTAGRKPSGGLFDSGVSLNEDIVKNAQMMIGTTLIYLVIQIPASMAESTGGGVSQEAISERLPALMGMVLSAAGFFFYLYACYKQSLQNEGGNAKVLDRVIEGIKAGEVSLSAALQFSADDAGAGSSEPLLNNNASLKKKVEPIVKPFFQKYDTNNSKSLDLSEFKILLGDLGEKADDDDVKSCFEKFDKNKSGDLSLAETVDCMINYLTDPQCQDKIKQQVQKEKTKGAKTMATYTKKEKQDGGDEDEEEEEEEMPEDLRDLSADEQQSRIKRRAGWMMALGTFIVLFVSDPFVDVLNVWGTRLGVPAFYVSFLIAPFASNASELLSAYTYAAKKTKSSITTALSTLIGAACMNNTFVLFIFFCLVYFKKLAWRFTAETVAIMVIQWIIGGLAIFKKVHSLFMGGVIFACYPLCLCIVAGLEAHGLD